MVEINHRERFLRAKILYYGPAAGGKTTSLQVLHRRARSRHKLDLVSVNTTQDRTILFDLLPLNTPAFRGHDLRFQVVAVPGQRLYAATRKMLLKNADAVVFVANSARDRWQENLQSLKEMTDYLLSHGIEPSSLPIVFQYNKRDLPDKTDLEIMERGLNARGSDGIESVAIREEGVLEAFAAILRRMMTELATRYRIGENIEGARSAQEWTERTMSEMFDARPSAPADASPRPEPSRTVVRVKAPSAARTSLSREPKPQPIPPVPSPLASSAEPPARVPPFDDVSAPPPSGSMPSAAAEIRDPDAAHAMLESYAEAASSLTDHISDLRDERELVRRRAEDFALVADVAKRMLGLSGPESVAALRQLVEAVARRLHAPQACLSLLAPDERLVLAVGYGLAVDPMESSRTPGGRPLGRAILEAATPVVQARGEPGPLGEAIDRAGMECVAVAVLPLTTPRPLGLLAFYLAQESPIPNRATTEHLERVALQLGLALESTSQRLVEGFWKAPFRQALAGQVSSSALAGSARALDKIKSNLSRLRGRPDAPAWLDQELAHAESSLLGLESFRRMASGLHAGQLPPAVPTSIPHLLGEMKPELERALSSDGIRFQVDLREGLGAVAAEPHLLKAVIHAMVETGRRALGGGPSGGVIRILAQPEPSSGGVHLAVFDNALALSAHEDAGRFLRWPAENRLAELEKEMLQPIIEHLRARWTTETRPNVGTLRNLVLPRA